MPLSLERKGNKMNEFQTMQQHLQDLNSLAYTCASPEEAKRRQQEYLAVWLSTDRPPEYIEIAYDEKECQYVILDNRG